MALPACCLYLLLLVLVGYAMISAIQPSTRMNLFQLTGLGAALGAGTTGLLLFWASLIGFAPSRILLAVIGVLALVTLLVMEKKHRLPRPRLWPDDWEKGDRWIVVPLFVTVAGLAIIAGSALSVPPVDLE